MLSDWCKDWGKILFSLSFARFWELCKEKQLFNSYIDVQWYKIFLLAYISNKIKYNYRKIDPTQNQTL